MRKLISSILVLFPLVVNAQTEPEALEEVIISPDFVYETGSVYIKANEDASFQYSILDMDKNNTLLTGKVKTLEPMVRTGQYTFYTPGGQPYASGYFSNNIPFRVWSYFDGNGQVVSSVNYSAAIQYQKNYGEIDLGEDFVLQAKKAPKFSKGGLKGFQKFIRDNAVYPPFTLINNMEGTVVCQFIIDKTGKLINIRILEGLNEDFDMEVIRVLSLSPLWKPGKKNGNPVNVLYSLPIHFKILSETE